MGLHPIPVARAKLKTKKIADGPAILTLQKYKWRFAPISPIASATAIGYGASNVPRKTEKKCLT